MLIAESTDLKRYTTYAKSPEHFFPLFTSKSELHFKNS